MDEQQLEYLEEIHLLGAYEASKVIKERQRGKSLLCLARKYCHMRQGPIFAKMLQRQKRKKRG